MSGGDTRNLWEFYVLFTGKTSVVRTLTRAEEQLGGDNEVCPAQLELLDHSSPAKWRISFILMIVADESGRTFRVQSCLQHSPPRYQT